VASAAHLRGLVRAAGVALQRELGVVQVELTVPDPRVADAYVALTWQPATGLAESPVTNGVTSVPCAPPQPVGSRPKLRRVHGQWELLLPIPMRAEHTGQLALRFPDDDPPDVVAETDLLLALASVIGMACHACGLVTKVAAVSRRAHHERKRLAKQTRKPLPEHTPPPSHERPIVALSQAMRRVLEQAELVAPHPTPVLLRGELGTGKRDLAQHIHQRSGRAHGPLVMLDCSALPAALIESELFGRDRQDPREPHASAEPSAGSALADAHIGRFERASGGTLFLDEVSALPEAAQAKLLRALQEGVIVRAFGREPIAVDVRVVAATREPLEDLIADGRFRSDLYYHLAVFPIALPALRDRPEDIPELAKRKLHEMSSRIGRPPPELTATQVRTLCGAAWPGNVRELHNYLERALISSTDQAFQLPPLASRAASSKRKSANTNTNTSTSEAVTLDDAIEHVIAETLAKTRGKLYGKDGAAAALGLKPSTLQSKMRKLGIERERFTERR
jgi:formate hydrogenlyase transcriptional activator